MAQNLVLNILAKDKTKVAVKVVDIFGNDTMKVLEVKV